MGPLLTPIKAPVKTSYEATVEPQMGSAIARQQCPHDGRARRYQEDDEEDAVSVGGAPEKQSGDSQQQKAS